MTSDTIVNVALVAIFVILVFWVSFHLLVTDMILIIRFVLAVTLSISTDSKCDNAENGYCKYVLNQQECWCNSSEILSI